ncbi:MAG: glutaredoxin family protein [Burkholderiales bacterium]
MRSTFRCVLMAQDKRRRLTLLSREYCHLCEEMIVALRELEARRGDFEFEIVNIDEHPQLEERYGERVPVLLLGDKEICHYHLNPAALDICLTRRG